MVERATDAERFANKRAEESGRMREAFESQHISIPHLDDLVPELTSL